MNCLNLPEFAFDEWGEVLLRPLNGKRYPLAAEFELTERCNQACKHCFINQPAGSMLARRGELTTIQVKDVLDQIAEAGCLHLLLTGGEPLLRPDFPEIYLHARRRGMLTMVFTNGTMLTPEIIKIFQESPPVLVEVSVYGATRQTYEYVTGLPGSYDRFINGLKLLKESGLRAATKSALLSLNRHELTLMQTLADELGLPFRYDGSMWPRVDGADKPLDYRLSIEEMIELDNLDPERMQAWMDTYVYSKDLQMRSNQYIFNCGAGYRSFHIDSAGQLSACMMARKPSFSIPELGFETAWANLGEFRMTERTKYVACQDCSASGMCAQCPGWSQLVHDDNETIVDYICQLTKTREQIISYNLMDIKEE